MTGHWPRFDKLRGRLGPWGLRLCRSVAAVAAILLLCLTSLPALAHDDEAPAPPDPETVAASGKITIAVLGLVVGGVVYYMVQRHSVVNASKHPPEWQNTMNRNAILLAIGSAVAVWLISSALSKPARRPPNVSVVEPWIENLRLDNAGLFQAQNSIGEALGPVSGSRYPW